MQCKIIMSDKETLGADTNPVVAVQDWIEYNPDGKRGRRLGSTYDVLMLSCFCEKLRVHVEDSASIITQDELDKHNKSMNFCMVRFEGFKGRPYVDKSGRLAITARADKIILVNSGSGAVK